MNDSIQGNDHHYAIEITKFKNVVYKNISIVYMNYVGDCPRRDAMNLGFKMAHVHFNAKV